MTVKTTARIASSPERALAWARLLACVAAGLVTIALGPTGGIPFGLPEVLLFFAMGAVFGKIATSSHRLTSLTSRDQHRSS